MDTYCPIPILGLTCKVQNCLRRELSFTDGLNRNAVGLRGPQRSSRT